MAEIKIPLIIENGQVRQLQDGETLPGLDQLDGFYVTVNTDQQITGQKHFTQDLILNEGQKLIFDGKQN